jgi:hypothetical protein
MDLHPEHAMYAASPERAHHSSSVMLSCMRACIFLACKVDNYRGKDNLFVEVKQHTTIEIQDQVSVIFFPFI